MSAQIRYNIAVGGFHHETNTFSPAPTPYDEFLKADGWPALTRGDAILPGFSSLNLPIGGFLNAASDNTIIPTAWANAEPYGRVTKDAFERISSMIVDALPAPSTLDAVYLDLHGAMVTEHHDDGEGALLKLVKDKIGHDIPLVISLDFHANLTPEMFRLSDAITIFRTYPHIDMADTGRRAFQLLEQLLQRNEKFKKAYRQVPYLIPLSDQHTGSPPCNRWLETVQNTSNATLSSIDIAYGFPPADIYHCGPALVAYGSSKVEADNAADQLLATIISDESKFTDNLVIGDEAVRTAIELGRPGSPVVIADVQDNPGAGGSSDTTDLLRSLVEQNTRGAVIGSIWDPSVASQAHSAGIGAVITVELGGKNGPDGVTPFTHAFSVERLSDGKFSCNGEMLGGIELDLGPMALLRVAVSAADVKVVVSSERFQCLDQGLFRELGVEPAEQSIVVVKSTIHFRADFDPIAKHTLLAQCPGVNPCGLETVPYKHLRPKVRLGPCSEKTSPSL